MYNEAFFTSLKNVNIKLKYKNKPLHKIIKLKNGIKMFERIYLSINS